MLISGRLCLLPTSKSLGSCAGVIFTQPVPNSLSTYSSATTGISLPTSGSISFFPTMSLYLSSEGFTATALSPKSVSGLVVAISTNLPSSPAIGYLICQKLPSISICSTSASEMDVLHSGHQFMILFPL